MQSYADTKLLLLGEQFPSMAVHGQWPPTPGWENVQAMTESWGVNIFAQ